MDASLGRVMPRIKARSWPLGASRYRLFLVLRHLGLQHEVIVARQRAERAIAREPEIERQRRFQEAQRREQARAARLRLMKDAKLAARQMEEDVLGWLQE